LDWFEEEVAWAGAGGKERGGKTDKYVTCDNRKKHHTICKKLGVEEGEE
jgi:hypothetical protein